MKPGKINLIAAVFFTTGILFSQDARWTHSKELKIIGKEKYKFFFLDKEVYRHANPDLSDLRIMDKDRNELAFIISGGLNIEKKETADYEPKLIKEFNESPKDKESYRVFDFQVLSDKKDFMINSMILTFSQETYSYQADVYGRSDDSDWQFIVKDSLYNINGFEKNEIKFHDSLDLKFYRIRIPVKLDAVSSEKSIKAAKCILSYSGYAEKFQEFRNAEKMKFTVSDKKKHSIIRIENPDHLKIMNFDLSADSNFSRFFEIYDDDENLDSGHYYARGRIYRMNFAGEMLSDTVIEPAGIPVTDKTIILKIINNDDRPLKIKNITAEYVCDKLIFEIPSDINPAKNNISLFFGNSSAVKPVYDMENFAAYIEKEKMDLVETGKSQNLGNTKTKNSDIDFKLLFNIIIAAVAMFLIAGIVLLLKKK